MGLIIFRNYFNYTTHDYNDIDKSLEKSKYK